MFDTTWTERCARAQQESKFIQNDKVCNGIHLQHLGF